jgi:3-oxoadipate enol-lactonase
MPLVRLNGANIYYEEHGIGPEVILFSHGLVLSSKVFKDQFEYFKARYKCVVYDHRGQGRSEVTEEGYEMESLANDTVELIRTLNIGPCHMLGLSTGGYIAMRLAIKHRELLKSLILIDSSAESEPNKLKYNFKKTLVSVFGVKTTVNGFMKLLFSEKFLNDPAREEDVSFWKNEILQNKKTIVKSIAGYLNRESILGELDNIPMPTLVMVGDQDQIMPAQMAKNIKLKIPQARLAVIKDAGHCTTIEEPWQVIETIEVFLNGVH